jgi:hypothetical protein
MGEHNLSLVQRQSSFHYLELFVSLLGSISTCGSCISSWTITDRKVFLRG